MKTHLLNIISEAESALAKLEDPVPAPGPDTKLTLSLAREAQGDRQAEVRVEWDPTLSELPDFDIWYYDPQRHREWQLNIKMHVPDADLSKGQWDFPIWAGTCASKPGGTAGRAMSLSTRTRKAKRME